MTKKELIEALEPYDDDMDIKLYNRYDDYHDASVVRIVTNFAYADDEDFISIE